MSRAGLDSAGTTVQWLVSRFTRYFFVLLAVFAIFIAAVVFVPDFLKFAAGTFPIAWVLNIHGALMATWLALFFTQAFLASTRRLALHRKLGTFGIVLGFPVWASMVLVEMRRKVVHPLDPDFSQEYDFDLPGIYVYTTFLVFFIAAIYQRRRWPRLAQALHGVRDIRRHAGGGAAQCLAPALRSRLLDGRELSGRLPSCPPDRLPLFLGEAVTPCYHCCIVRAPWRTKCSLVRVGKSRVAPLRIQLHRCVALHVLSAR